MSNSNLLQMTKSQNHSLSDEDLIHYVAFPSLISETNHNYLRVISPSISPSLTKLLPNVGTQMSSKRKYKLNPTP